MHLDTKLKKHAHLVWDYMNMQIKPERSDVAIVLGSTDIRTAEVAAKLYNEGLADLLLMSGGNGRLTAMHSHTEAWRYKQAALQHGVPEEKILVEDKSANSGENTAFSYKLLNDYDIHPKTITLVHKPYVLRRAYATFMKQWPEQSIKVYTAALQINFDEYVNDYYTPEYVTNVMVGDLQRIIEYPKLGYQIEQPVPADVMNAYKALIAAGFTKHLLTS